MVSITPSVPQVEPLPERRVSAVPTVPQVPALTESQIAQFKRDGFLVLPGALDPELCRRARDDMWEAIGTYLPRMKRGDPSTWTPITDEEKANFPVAHHGGQPYFGGGGTRYYVRNGTKDFMLDPGPPRALDRGGAASWQGHRRVAGRARRDRDHHWSLPDERRVDGSAVRPGFGHLALASHIQDTNPAPAAARARAPHRTGNAWPLLHAAQQPGPGAQLARGAFRWLVLRPLPAQFRGLHRRPAARVGRLHRVAGQPHADLGAPLEDVSRR